MSEGGHFSSSSGNSRENRVNAANGYMLAFLGGEFSYVREKAMNVTNALGWSASFMKCGLAAFLLLLAGSTGQEETILQGTKLQETLSEGGLDIKPQKDLRCGGREMRLRVAAAVGFDKAEYEKGTLRRIEESNEEWFWKCWLRWRETVVLSAEERAELLQWAEALITMRVKGIMEGNHRKYYRECAAYIAALGEAKEAGGQRNGKQDTMRAYMNLYSRRSAFREELQSFGMEDFRKRK